MKTSQIQYRIKQFKQSISAIPSHNHLKEVNNALSEKQYRLFQQLHPSEQYHAILVFQQLIRQGYSHPHLLAAALLHDIGKIRYPLKNFQRVLIVLAKRLFPKIFIIAKKASPRGWIKPFIVATKHGDWGAELAALCESHSMTVSLIKKHQLEITEKVIKIEDQFLLALQQADNTN